MPSPKVITLLSKKENAHSDPIYCCVWTSIKIENASAKDFIITAGLDCCIKIWTLKYDNLELMHLLKGHAMAVISVAASPDGHTLASSSLDGTLTIWDVVTGTKVHNIKTGAVDVWKIVFSPDGTHVATGGHSGKIVIYSVINKEIQKAFDTRGNIPTCIDWSKDDKYICTGSVDGIVCIYDIAQGKLLHSVKGHTAMVRGVAICGKSQQLASVSSDGKLNLYDISSTNITKSTEDKSWATAVCFSGSKESERVACARADGTILLLLAPTFMNLGTLRKHMDAIWGVCFNPNGEKLVSVSADKSINIYECPRL